MQYIQLQGQVAAELDLPIAGGYNLFIDASDNTIKVKDSNGNYYGGGSGINEVTKMEMDDMINAGALSIGTFYMITNASSGSFNEVQYGGTRVILQAVTTSSLSNDGVGLFWNPKYSNSTSSLGLKVWDGTNRFNFTTSNGYFAHDDYIYLNANGTSSYCHLVGNVGGASMTLSMPEDSHTKFFENPANYPFIATSDTNPTSASIDYAYYTSSYNIGDKVIYGGLVHRNLTGQVGTQFGGDDALYLDNTNWQIVPFNTDDYVLVADKIKYEYEFDNISYRADAYGNEVSAEWAVTNGYWGFNAIRYFPWGHQNVTEVTINNGYIYNLVNFPNYNGYNHNQLMGISVDSDGGEFDVRYWGRGTSMYDITIGKDCGIYNLYLGFSSTISNIKIESGAYLYNIYGYDMDDGGNLLKNITIGQNSTFRNLFFYFDSYMYDITLDSNAYFGYLSLYNFSGIFKIYLESGADFEHIDLYDNSQACDIRVGNNSYFGDMEFGINNNIQYITMGGNSVIEYIGTNDGVYIEYIDMKHDSNIICMGIDSYGTFSKISMENNSVITATGIGNNSQIAEISVGNSSGLNTITLASSSYFRYHQIDAGSGINNITIGANSNMQNFSVKSDSEVTYVTLGNYSYFNDIHINGDTYVGNINIYNYCGINDASIGEDSGFLDLTISGSSVEFSNIEIGQSSGIGNTTITSSLQYATVSRGFSNFQNTQLQDPSGSNGTTGGRPNINFGSRDIITFDISGISTFQTYHLPDGEYEGQELTFILKSDGSHTITPEQFELWSSNIVMTGYAYNLGDHSGAIKPFARLNVTDGGNTYIWKNMTKAVWTSGKWYSDAELYND